MKKILTLLTAMMALAPLGAQVITLAADEWAPFNMVPGSKYEGYMVDVAREVFEPLGYRVQYQVVSWNRAVAEARKGVFTGIIGASKTDGEGFIFPQEELGESRLSFFVKKGHPWKFTQRDSVKAVTLGVIDGYDYREWLLSYIAQAKKAGKVHISAGDNPLEKNLKLLVSGRIDAVVDNKFAILYTAGLLGFQDQLQFVGSDTLPSQQYIAFSPALPESAKYAQILSQGIQKLRATGRLAVILARYGLQDWK